MAAKNEQQAIADLMATSGVGFGTSGARGLAEAMNDRVCYAYTIGFLQYLEKCGDISPGDEVAVAGDLRPSTPRIMQACISAIQDLGYQSIYCGFIPSPAVANYGISLGVASLMVTGSHIPDDRNGIKFNKPTGEVLKSDEGGIRQQVVQLAVDLFTDEGRFIQAGELPEVDQTARRHFINRYLDFFAPGCLAGCSILLYEHSSVASSVLLDIFLGLGADVERIAYSDTFIPVDTEAVRTEDVALARQWAHEKSFDMIVSTDGDGDRPLLGNEKGEWLRGDVLGVLVAYYMQADAVVTPVSSNTVLEKSEWFEQAIRTRIGSPYVIEGMQQAASAGAKNVAGYEANGGFLTHDPIEKDGRILSALPTRDAILPAIVLLLLARQQGVAVSELSDLLPPRFTASDRLKNFATSLSQEHIATLAEGGSEAIMSNFPGLGDVIEVDQTDGLRITFSNEEIVHLRPSGNAPELRCYNEASSAQRAAELNAQCLQILSAWQA